MQTEIKTLEPIFKDNYTAIAMSSSDEYIPYLSVCLQSLVEHTSNNHNYDIVIFSTSENELNKNIIIDTYSKKNISVRFYNPSEIVKDLKMTVTHKYFNEACYYRIASPLVMKSYNKVIFTDIDLIFNTDIQALSAIDIGDHPIASCQECIWKTLIENNEEIHKIKIRDYAKKTLKLQDINTYYNTGVILINIQNYNKNSYYSKLKEAINNNYFLYQEQDALNYLLKTQILALDNNWNYEVSDINTENLNINEAKIIHYLGSRKPWSYPELKYCYLWWNYARRSPFYEVLMKNLLEVSIFETILLNLNKNKYRVKSLKYRILSKITFGKAKKHYQYKNRIWNDKIKSTKFLRGNI